ncbi:Methionine synthase [Poriferisphaera corsica]|uniref:Methionine synthase n=1 Tax=Poriferisphaera corsica TaxID=2528020 RepID=A0A517YVH5_9BACT|nr:methionine synthase [Poriferisphaera corsica]QDU34238.1 Methionine synthase [Poriferisphaera corsica]
MSQFVEQLKKRVLFLDGAMGTSIHKIKGLDLEKDYLGRENCTEVLLLTRPELIQQIHEEYLEAGADAVETDSFNSSIHTMEDQDLSDRVYELNRLAAETAKQACEKWATDEKPRFVVGSIGPGTKLISLGQIGWDEMLESYKEQVRGLVDGGADVLLIETAQDILQVKCVVNAAIEALAEKGLKPDVDGEGDVPIMVQVTIEQFGTTLVGTDIAGVAAALDGYPILSVGMNCATGPTEMAEHVQWLSENWRKRISLLPNAGLPTLVEGETVFPLEAEPFAEKVGEFVVKYGLNIVGGCCGTTPAHIKALVEKVGDQEPLQIKKAAELPGVSSLMGAVAYEQDASILNVGERTNASGSRKFKRLLEEESWDEIMSLAKEMVREGSHVVDVNVDYAGRDNQADMKTVVQKLVNQVNAPLMLDSTQPATIEAGLKCAGGKCIINSGNLEDGEEKFAVMCRLAKKYNAGLVLGCIDEDPEEAMARTAERKLSIAKRMYDLATTKYGLDGRDLMFDPLVLPISTGMDKDRRSALETIEGTRQIQEVMPESQMTCGLSNVSFGLKPAARQVLNSVFLSELVKVGMNSAILHVSKILPKQKIDETQWNAALDLVYNRWADEPVTLQDGTETKDPLQIFVDMFGDDAAVVSTKVDMSELPLEERLQKHIIDGEKRDLESNLDEAMKQYAPVEIINEHLLEGMKVVGELFGSGQMQLPFVLQSAEVMKAAVAYLEQFMEKVEGTTKGTMLLATVRGDVHDIGKNLVDIILSNNGYTVHNIGIKVPINEIVEKYRELKPDVIGLSGLLVKSVNVMEEYLKELNDLGIDVPMILGGAALSRPYCETHLREVYQGDVFHGTDAFEGLRVMDMMHDGKQDGLNEEIEVRLGKRAETDKKLAEIAAKKKAKIAAESAEGGTAVAVKSDVAIDVVVPTVPFFGSRVVEEIDLNQVYPFINEVALFRGQWQFKKGRKTAEEYEQQLEDDVRPLFRDMCKRFKDEGVLRPKVVYGYWPCQSEGEDLIIFDPEDHDKEIERFTWPRQKDKKRLCVSDFFKSVESGEKDVIGLSCVTMGSEVSKVAKKLYDANSYQEYLYTHGLGVEACEGCAEMWHKRMRQEMGIDGGDSPKIRELFTQKYRGSRYSFGYPAVPEMSDQDKLFGLLKPERIGCQLTENWQIDPEQSTSAIVVHHPEAKYFNV